MKKRLLIAVFVVCATLACAVSGPDDRTATDPKTVTSASNPEARPVPVEDLFYSRSVFGAAWSPDGKQLVFTTNLTGRYNLWKVSTEGGFPIQLAASDDRQGDATWSPDGKWIVYDQDYGGNESYDLFAIPADGGDGVNLTNTPDIREDNPLFSPDGSRVGFFLKPKTSSAVDLAILDFKTHAVRNLTNEKTKDHLWGSFLWSRDGRYVFGMRGNAAFTDSDLYRIDAQSGEQELLTPHSGDVLYDINVPSPDGRTLLIYSNQKGGFPNLALLDLATKKLTWITDTQWEAQVADFAPDGKSIAYQINADGRTSVFLSGLDGRGSKLDFPEGLTTIAGKPSAFSPDGTRLLLSHQDSQRPSDLWIYELKSHKARQLTYSAIASLSPRSLPPSQLVHYKSFDGKMISAFLWMPFNLKRDGSNPAVVLPHGGPTGQLPDVLNRTAAALSSRGYICIAPNVRGSTGYGMDFQKANYQDLGGGDLQDEIYATRFLLDTGYVDPKKIGITGGSYGGYMTLMATGKTPDTWAAGVELYGIIDWFTMLQHEDPLLQEYEKSLLGDPAKDREVYERASPIRYLQNAKAPLLVLQGDNDIRVPKEEAEQVVAILKKNGRTVDAKFYPQEGHGFAKRENQIDAIRRTIDWFDKYLKGARASSQ